MEGKIEQEKNYAELLKQELEKLANEGIKNSNNLTLEARLIERNKELHSHLEENNKNLYALFIITNSLFFLKGNDFIKDNYFSSFDNAIYKLFYELLLRPNETQFELLQSEFKKLDYGAGAIFILCTEIYTYFGMSYFDLFFSIVIKDNFYRIEKLIKKKASNYDKFLEKLKTFKEQSEIKQLTALTFFIEAMSDPQIQSNINKNISLNTESKEKDNNKLKFKENRISESQILNKNIEKEENEKKISKEKEKIDYNSNIPNAINNDQINSINENIYVNKFLEHLKKMKKIYEKICPTPVLDFLIQNNGELKLDYIGYLKNKDSFIDHIHDNLIKLIKNLRIGEFNEDTQGYFCYLDEYTNEYIEALYSKIDLDLLFNKITADENFPKDNFIEPDIINAKNAFKSRALSFEYYINNMIIIEKFKMKERPRAIYPFKSLEEILENKEKASNLVEVDGVILEQKRYDFTLEKNAFIVDELYKIDEFETTNRQIVAEPYIEKAIDIKKNELCIIEIKNQFPPSTDTKNQFEINEKPPSTFYQVVKGMIKKAKIFKQLYELKKEKIDNIRLMLFHDTIQKENYYEYLKKAFADSFQENDKSKYMYEFQCIYIKSSYLAAGLFNMNETFLKLKKEFVEFREKTQEKLINSSKEILSLRQEIVKINKDKLEDKSKLAEHIINSSTEIANLKSEFSKYMKDNSEKTIALQTQLFNSEKKNIEESNQLNNIICGLLNENIILKENIFAIEKMEDFEKKGERYSKTEEENNKNNSEKKSQEVIKVDELIKANITQKIIDDIKSLKLEKDIEEKILKKLKEK